MTDPQIRLIETLRVEPGRRLPLLAWHQRRLRHSCETLGYVYPGSRLEQSLNDQVKDLEAGHHYKLRITLAPGGEYELDAPTRLPVTTTPLRLRLNQHAPAVEMKWLQHKTTRRPWYDEASRWLAEHPDYFDVIFFNDRDELCEGSRSNVYIRDIDGAWLTPPAECGLLPGVQRQALIDQGLVREAVVSRAQFLRASSIRVSNALRGWLEAIAISPADGATH